MRKAIRRMVCVLWVCFSLLYLLGWTQGNSETTESILKTDTNEYHGRIRLSELMLKNKASCLEPDFPDWVELQNWSDNTVTLDGWTLTDRPGGEPLALDGTTISPKGYCVLPLDGESFSLSNGETVCLYDPSGVLQDSVLCQTNGADHSLQRQMDGSLKETAWISPGFDNTAEGYEQFAAGRETPETLCIWEAMVSNRSHPVLNGSRCDWVELRNNSDHVLSLKGWSLSDDREEPNKWSFEERDLEPGALALVLCDNDADCSEINTGFSLNALAEQLYLFDENGRLIDWVYLHDIPVEGSMGRMQENMGFFYFSEPTPGEENLDGARRVSEKPTSSTPSGIYENVEEIRVDLQSPGLIYYTTDGSVPTLESELYIGPIKLDHTTVIRACALETGARLSRPASFSYVINEGHSLPVLSLSTDSPAAFQSIYNGAQKNTPVSANLSYYDTNGEVFNQDCELEMKGWTSLSRPKKSMGVSFKDRYGGDLRCELFGDGIDRYSSLSIRAGQDYTSSFFRNELCQDLCREASEAVYTQATRCSILYVNGEYWGIYNLKEDISRSFYASHAGVSVESVEANRAPVATYSPFFEVVKLGLYENLGTNEGYQKVADLVDMDSMIDWLLLECYCANTDTQGNLRLYRSTENDNKWDFCFYDLDWSFGWTGGSFVGMLGGGNNAGGDIPPLIMNLSRNQTFREKLIRRYAQLSKGVLSNEHVLEKIEAYQALLEPEMPRECQRWNTSLHGWTVHVDELKAYIRDQDWINYTIDQLLLMFKCSDDEAIEYFGRVAEHHRFG